MELKMKKICIITSFTDHIRWDDYGKCDYGQLSSENHSEYSYKHNYTFIKEIVNNNDYPEWHPTWIKINVLRKYLPLFDYVVWIDADAVFYNQDISIESFLQDDIDLVIPKLEFDRVGQQMWTHTTTGFMIWRNSEWSKKTLDYLWENPQGYKTNFFHEQSRLDEILIDKFNLPGGENILNKDIVDLTSSIKLDNVLVIPFSYHRCFEDGEIKFLYHAGGNTHTKYSRIKSILNKE
jgi:hypothetical protein